MEGLAAVIGLLKRRVGKRAGKLHPCARRHAPLAKLCRESDRCSWGQAWWASIPEHRRSTGVTGPLSVGFFMSK